MKLNQSVSWRTARLTPRTHSHTVHHEYINHSYVAVSQTLSALAATQPCDL